KGERDLITNAEFFKINDRKLNSLLKATKQDMAKAEVAMLRKANDEYRKTIFNAQVYANTGAGTYEQCIDMATKDFLSKGINCIEYKNGARVNIADYAAMAIQTANKRAYLQGEGAKRQEWGISTVITIRHGGGCPKCVPFQGKVFIDDVWSGGEAYINGKQGNKTSIEGKSTTTGNIYPLISSAIAAGFYHPNCKDSHTTYFEGISTPPKSITKEQQQKSIDIYNMEQKAKYAERMVRKYKNLESGSFDEENKKRYKNKRQQWKNVANSYNGGIIETRVISGALNPYSEEAQAHADRYYESVRHMKTDVKNIARNVQWNEKAIFKIKEHIFIKQHDLGNAMKERFYSSYDMAQSWQRLIDGKDIREQDLVLLKHEYLELTLMGKGLSQQEAHNKANTLHNFASYLL
ncbi:phage minor capsid protein, partial [Clostridium sp.]|uniref:phage minor capsid protein n=1 Tax=Clostridium sp. TaxID=1506 RepID=UPI002FC9A563